MVIELDLCTKEQIKSFNIPIYYEIWPKKIRLCLVFPLYFDQWGWSCKNWAFLLIKIRKKYYSYSIAQKNVHASICTIYLILEVGGLEFDWGCDFTGVWVSQTTSPHVSTGKTRLYTQHFAANRMSGKIRV